jgi:hypothetical protein
MRGVIAHFESPSDHLGDAGTGPQLGCVPAGARPWVEQADTRVRGPTLHRLEARPSRELSQPAFQGSNPGRHEHRPEGDVDRKARQERSF